MRRPPLLLASLVVAVPALAAAQTAAPGAVPVEAVPATPMGPGTYEPAAVVEPPALTGIERRSAEDAAADRAYLASTALIAPSGTITFTARAPIGPFINGKLSASVSDRLELGVGTIQVAEDDDDLYSAHAKLQLWRGPRAALAAAVDLYTNEEGTLFLPSLVASFCGDGDACRTLLNLHLTAVSMTDEDELPVLPGVSISMGGRAQLIGEAHLFRDEDRGDRALLGYLGGRWSSGKLALDGGLGFIVLDDNSDCGDCSHSEPEALPWPFVGLSARL